jgi:hypothetical protein
MKLRIHHFFDIIRDFGSEKEIVSHPYLHSYQQVANEILANSTLKLEIIVASDAVCLGCIHLVNSKCDDIIMHRTDFRKKEDFNNYLDDRIIEVCEIDTSASWTPEGLCMFAKRYIDHIFYIYEGNDRKHTLLRKKNVLKGLRSYSKWHGFKLEIMD